MNPTHIHLLLNHFPIIGTLIGGCLLLWGTLKSDDKLKSTSAFLLAVLAIIAIPVYLTGEPAEHAVKNLPDISKLMIEEHEEAATIAIWLMAFTGLVSLVALFFSRQRNPMAKIAFNVLLALCIFSFGAMARTGYLGGQIRHSEIRSGSAVVQPGGEQPGSDEKQEEHKNDKD